MNLHEIDFVEVAISKYALLTILEALNRSDEFVQFFRAEIYHDQNLKYYNLVTFQLEVNKY